jgi:diguanylate cyclase (GGDEF)-like protein
MTGPADQPRGIAATPLAGVDATFVLASRLQRLRTLYGSVIGLALICAVVGVLHGPLHDITGVELLRLGAAIVAVALALVARVRVRVGATYVALGWGEAALIVALYLVPIGWLPVVMLTGISLSMVVMRVCREIHSTALMAYNAASLTVAGSCAGLVAEAIERPHLAPFGRMVAVALVISALIYSIISIALTAAAVSARSGTPIAEVAARTLSGKLFMIVGNVTIGLLVVVILAIDIRWLMVLPPVLWLVRQSYSYRLRADEERRGWRVFATAARALNRLDEAGVAQAGIRGAARLFAADSVEVHVLRPDSTVWCYRGGAESEVVAGPVESVAVPDPDPVTARALLVSGMGIGELRLRFGRSIKLTRREQMQLSAFGDALAAALHDASSHRALQALTARSSHEALHDPLTGIGNRSALLLQGAAAQAALDADLPVALLLLDIDHFKEINDTLGHAAGDDLLRVTAARLGAQSRPGELVARLGGDEFALLLTALPSPAGDDTAALDYARGRARDLADLLAVPTEVAGVQLAVEASVGVAAALAGSCDITELLRRADIAMYLAKRGGGAVACYDSGGDLGSTDRLALLAELREALNSDQQLVLALQPAIDLRTGAATGVEALIRWRHPRRGELPPSAFIDVLENSELVTPFTRYVIDKALAIVAGWTEQGLSVPISVNLSPRSLLDRTLPDQVAELLRRHDVEPCRLVLEITETVVVPESQTVTDVLAALRTLGVQLAVDDFGTGYSSLTFLTRVRVDEVKVDQTFVARMAESPEATAIVRTTVDLARQLGLRVVAEGVETAEQKAVLLSLGCTTAQGYHFFHPMPAEKATGVLRHLARTTGARVIPLHIEEVS